MEARCPPRALGSFVIVSSICLQGRDASFDSARYIHRYSELWFLSPVDITKRGNRSPEDTLISRDKGESRVSRESCPPLSDRGKVNGDAVFGKDKCARGTSAPAIISSSSGRDFRRRYFTAKDPNYFLSITCQGRTAFRSHASRRPPSRIATYVPHTRRRGRQRFLAATPFASPPLVHYRERRKTAGTMTIGWTNYDKGLRETCIVTARFQYRWNKEII